MVMFYEIVHHYKCDFEFSYILIQGDFVVSKESIYLIYLDIVKNQSNILLFDEFKYGEINYDDNIYKILYGKIYSVLQSKLSDNNQVTYLSMTFSDFNDIPNGDVMIYHTRQDKIRNLFKL